MCQRTENIKLMDYHEELLISELEDEFNEGTFKIRDSQPSALILLTYN